MSISFDRESDLGYLLLAMPFQVPHTHAIAPFRVVGVGAVYGSRDEVIGSKSHTKLDGIGTVGFAFMKAAQFNLELGGDYDHHYEVRDSNGSGVFQASTHDLCLRKLPEPVRAPRADDDICF